MVPPQGLVGRCKSGDVDAGGGGPVDDLVLDVGDVGDVGDVQPTEDQIAPEHIEDQGEPSVAEVGHPVDGGTAHVEAHLSRTPQMSGCDLASGRVVEPEHARYGNPIMAIEVNGPVPAGAGPTGIPDKPGLEGLEALWADRWEAAGTYAFDRSAPRQRVFAIDTPPPTVSGSLHIGHIFSYTHTDAVARFWRMRGKAVFYPMGWDDNGLPTERRVQNYFGVRCDPSLPFDPDFVPPDKPPKHPVAVSRPNFVAFCNRLTTEDEKVFEHLWRTLGLSVDWSHTYATVATGPSGSRNGASSTWPNGARWSNARLPPCGTSISAPPCRRPSWRTASARRLSPCALCPRGRGRRRRHRDHPSRTPARLCGPGGPSRR